MRAHTSFAELMRRVRAGDEEAAAELVRHYEPEIRRIVRIRLGTSRLRTLLDSADIFQSVMANFFVRVAAGQFELETPEQLLKLLVTMACNRLNDQARRMKAGKRGEGHAPVHDSAVLKAVADSEAGPSQVIAMKELLQKVRGSLTADELRLAEERARGRSWDELADELGSTPEAVRKRLSRALDRVGRQLGLDKVRDD